MKKKIAIFTSIRSDYGLQVPIIKELLNSQNLELVLLVGGAHLKKDLGYTIDQIRNDGFKISHIFDFLSDDRSEFNLVNSCGRLMLELSEYLKANPVDFVLLYGDRFELLPLATACLIANIPMGHVSGGEITDGVIDNQVRHAVSKMAHLHFPAIEVYGKNLLKLGEEAWRVCVCGEPGLDFLSHFTFISKKDLFLDLNLNESLKTILLTFHPETINNQISEKFISEVIDHILIDEKVQILSTAANADAFGEKINHLLKSYENKNPRFKFVPSLGQKRYYSMLKYCHVMVGNSSSGIVESQSFELPVVNVGKRQDGRLTNINVVHSSSEIDSFKHAFLKASSDQFKTSLKNVPNMFGQGNSSKMIIDFIEKNLDKTELLRKRTIFS